MTPLRLLFEEFMDELLFRIAGFSRIPFLNDLLPLSFVQ
jgi:hypothetical protein